jgi:hypothetical protein
VRSLFVLLKRFNQKRDVIDEKERRSLGGWRERGYGPEEGQCHFITHSLTHLLSHNCSCCVSLLSLYYSTTRLPRATSRMIRSWSYVRLSSCLTRTRRAPSTCTSSRCAVFSSFTPTLLHSRLYTPSLLLHCESTVNPLCLHDSFSAQPCSCTACSYTTSTHSLDLSRQYLLIVACIY